MYLFEINKLLQPVLRPRQVLPYAILTFTQNGSYIPAIDAEPTAEQRMACNARLQQAVAQLTKTGSTHLNTLYFLSALTETWLLHFFYEYYYYG